MSELAAKIKRSRLLLSLFPVHGSVMQWVAVNCDDERLTTSNVTGHPGILPIWVISKNAIDYKQLDRLANHPWQ